MTSFELDKQIDITFRPQFVARSRAEYRQSGDVIVAAQISNLLGLGSEHLHAGHSSWRKAKGNSTHVSSGRIQPLAIFLTEYGTGQFGVVEQFLKQCIGLFALALPLQQTAVAIHGLGA
jgi:hypothetical protein